MPAPNARLGEVSVPGATAGAPAPAPMFSVPVAPAFVAITIGPVTTPPSAMVSVPVPRLPMFSPKLLLQVEPAPVTVTAPFEPIPLPILAVLAAVILMTLPPFAIVSVPVPKLPILRPPLGPLLQLEPGPVTVTVPIEPADNPTEAPLLVTVPPSWIVRVPMPWPPTTRVELFCHLEPASVTVTVPCPPGRLPTVPMEKLVNVPPVWIVSIPVPLGPTDRSRACAPGSAITVEFGVTVLMFPSIVCLGKPPIQLPLKNQLEVNCPVHSDWARAEPVDAARSARVARPVDERNLRPVRAGDATRCVRSLSRYVPRASNSMAASHCWPAGRWRNRSEQV